MPGSDVVRESGGGSRPLARLRRSLHETYQQPLLYNRVGSVDMVKLTDKAAADIDIAIARDWKPGSVKYSPPSGKKRGNIFGQ